MLTVAHLSPPFPKAASPLTFKSSFENLDRQGIHEVRARADRRFGSDGLEVLCTEEGDDELNPGGEVFPYDFEETTRGGAKDQNDGVRLFDGNSEASENRPDAIPVAGGSYLELESLVCHQLVQGPQLHGVPPVFVSRLPRHQLAGQGSRLLYSDGNPLVRPEVLSQTWTLLQPVVCPPVGDVATLPDLSNL